MKPLDRHLQKRRVAVASPWIRAGSHVLDVGCADGALFRLVPQIASGVGIDTSPSDGFPDGPFEARSAAFPDAVAADDRFDAIVMLAVVEHVPVSELGRWADAVRGALRPNGRLIVTTPSPVVDRILDAGIKLRLLDGMDVESHHGFDPSVVPEVFADGGLVLEHRRRFELGLNHLFVFTRPA